ncbi:MAG: AAA family ATPase [Bryobacteraceae bacterium]|nr:AAA family ATPase [Bryobacteraceae bacterium]
MNTIVPYLQMFQAGLAPEGRPAGVFLLAGPTGTGKTRTVESLAEVLHGSEKQVLRVDCGEFQMEHEVAKLIGAPPGYLGHRETQAMLNQARLNGYASEECGLSLVLFDEVEKAAPSLTRLLLGVLDRATLRLGDNNQVNFERTFIFMTSNLGGRAMTRSLRPDFGFEALTGGGSPGGALDKMALGAVKRRFPPEFVNRIDAVITYRPLTRESLARILDQQLAELQRHIHRRLGDRAFRVELSGAAREFLLDRGASVEYGARELRRTIQRHLTQPLAALLAADSPAHGSRIHADVAAGGETLALTAIAGA